MTQAPRGLDAIEKVCEKYAAHLAVRLHGEYQPGREAPFPDSPEHAEWVKQRETLTITVLRGDSEGIVLVQADRGGVESVAERRLPRAEIEPWLARLEAQGGWTLPSLPELPAGEGLAYFDHEGYEYFDEDPGSLDLDSWKPPRHARIARTRAAGDPAAAKALLALYRSHVPAAMTGMLAAFNG